MENEEGQQQEQPQPQQQEQISPEQWQQFIGNIQQQNQMLQQEANNAKIQLAEKTRQEMVEKINQLPDKERADALQAQLESIRQAGAAAQAQQISENVWQRRDADAAVRLLQMHGLNGTEPELYRGAWDVNWAPRFVASVDALVKTRAAAKKAPSGGNPANRANVGNTGSAIPDVDPGLSGFDTIRYALQNARK